MLYFHMCISVSQLVRNIGIVVFAGMAHLLAIAIFVVIESLAVAEFDVIAVFVGNSSIQRLSSIHSPSTFKRHFKYICISSALRSYGGHAGKGRLGDFVCINHPDARHVQICMSVVYTSVLQVNTRC